jgi:hypothetical protein
MRVIAILRGMRCLVFVLFVFCALFCNKAIAQSVSGSTRAPIDRGFDNSPDDIDSQLRESDERADSLIPIEPLQPLHDQWVRITRELRDSIGLDLGLNYTGLYQKSDEALPGKWSEASGGDFDVFGRWNLFNQGGAWPGALVFATEARHRYSNIPPSQLGEEVGSLWGTVVSFDTQDYALKQLYWEQGSYADQLIYRAGKMDPSDIYDGGRFVSSNYAFLSPAFSDTMTMPLRRQWRCKQLWPARSRRIFHGDRIGRHAKLRQTWSRSLPCYAVA